MCRHGWSCGRPTSTALPGDTTSSPTTSTTYTVTCPTTGAQLPCVEIDTTQRLVGSTTVTSKAFYDGYGRPVETQTPVPGGQTVVRYTNYDAAGHDVYDSIPFLVATPSGFVQPTGAPSGTSYTYDGLGRVLSVKDPLSHTTTTSYTLEHYTTDGAYYEKPAVVDANSHQTATAVDALGRTAYDELYTGSNPYTAYATTKLTYDFLGDVVTITQPDGTHTTTFSYDGAGRTLAMSDPDRGTESYGYDANGNVTQTTDARGTSGCANYPTTPCGGTWASYDPLDRLATKSTHSDHSSPYATWTYDESGHGSGIGHLTDATFTSPGASSFGDGSYAYTYDNRGETTAVTKTLNNTPYTFGFGYNDAGQPTTLTYSDNEVFTLSYDGASGWLSAATTQPQGAPQPTTLASGLAYTTTSSDPTGALGLPSGATVGSGTYVYAASHDNAGRLTATALRTSGGQGLFRSAPSYDAVGNVTSVSTIFNGTQTDNQAFCHDELNRLTWATSATATGPNGCASNTAGTLTSAQYTQSFSYDPEDRLTAGPVGSYAYGDSSHLHAATAVGSGYTAAYDAAGDMVWRAPTSSTTCVGTQTGGQYSYDNERRMVHWQTAPGSGVTPSVDEGYDGEGNRVEEVYHTSRSASTTLYLAGGLEEVGTGGTLTKCYWAIGRWMGDRRERGRSPGRAGGQGRHAAGAELVYVVTTSGREDLPRRCGISRDSRPPCRRRAGPRSTRCRATTWPCASPRPRPGSPLPARRSAGVRSSPRQSKRPPADRPAAGPAGPWPRARPAAGPPAHRTPRSCSRSPTARSALGTSHPRDPAS
jgi:YD repeat-containing protein